MVPFHLAPGKAFRLHANCLYVFGLRSRLREFSPGGVSDETRFWSC